MLNLGAAALIKGSGGCLFRAIVNAPGSTSGAFTLNDANALVLPQTITGITQAANAVVTLSTVSGTNPFAVGNTIAFAGVVGMTQINLVTGTVIAIGGSSGAWTVTTSINSSAFTAWASGGTAASYSAQNQVLTLAYNATANVAGAVFNLDWPFQNGILLSSVPGAGSPALAVSYV